MNATKLLDWLFDGGGPERLPERVRAAIQRQQERSEILIGWVQFGIVGLVLTLYESTRMAEGLVQGAIGAGLAFGLVFGLKVVLGRFVEDRGAALWRGFYLVNGDALQIGLIVLFVGAAIGMAGSWIGLRRFLEA